MKELLKNIPHTPGVYKMKDKEGRVIYVGKAKVLNKRIKSYFQKNYEHSYRTKIMIKQIADIECIQTDTELEALILENNLIKELKPKYNILMKDDKSYVYIKIDTREDFPRVKILREHTLEHTGIEHGPVKYFGPKRASSHVYETFHILKKILPFRHCNLDIAWQGSNKGSDTELRLTPEPHSVQVTNRVIDFPCLDYHIKRCPAPCIGAITPEAYATTIQSIIDFLSGKSDVLINDLTTQMKKAAHEKNFEKAAKIRDTLFSIESILEKQKISDPRRLDTDVIHGTSSMGNLYYSILLIRKGKIINQEQFVFDSLGMQNPNEDNIPLDEMEYFEAFLKQYYAKTSEIPKEIIVPCELEDRAILESWLSQLRGEKVGIIHPQKGQKNQLLELALKNAVTYAKQHRIKWLAEKQHEEGTERLAEALDMKNTNLRRIEGFDISHLGGTETVGSMVVFENGKAKPSNYRHFKIRTVLGKADDYKSMEELLTRRLKYVSTNGEKSGLRITKGSKKDIQNLAPTQGNYFIAKKDKKIVASVIIEKLTSNVSVIHTLWIAPEISPELICFPLLEKAIAYQKQKKIYIIADHSYGDFFASFGAVPIHSIPETLTAYASKKGIIEPYYMVYERIQRKKIDPSFAAVPDLILIDGGKGQLGIAVKVLKKLNLKIPVISLAKKLEEIFIPEVSAPILLDEGNPALRLLQHIRDESHRFAITFQRNLHIKGMYK